MVCLRRTVWRRRAAGYNENTKNNEPIRVPVLAMLQKTQKYRLTSNLSSRNFQAKFSIYSPLKAHFEKSIKKGSWFDWNMVVYSRVHNRVAIIGHTNRNVASLALLYQPANRYLLYQSWQSTSLTPSLSPPKITNKEEEEHSWKVVVTVAAFAKCDNLVLSIVSR